MSPDYSIGQQIRPEAFWRIFNFALASCVKRDAAGERFPVNSHALLRERCGDSCSKRYSFIEDAGDCILVEGIDATAVARHAAMSTRAVMNRMMQRNHGRLNVIKLDGAVIVMYYLIAVFMLRAILLPKRTQGPNRTFDKLQNQYLAKDSIVEVEERKKRRPKDTSVK
eukprot:IDg2410t1